MVDIDRESQASSPIQITGPDELYKADVVREKGFNKLYVKTTAAPQILGNMLFEYVKNGANENMKINGAVTNVPFTFANTTANDIVVSALQIEFECVTPGAAGFGGGTALPNGLLISIKSEDITFNFKPIKKNYHFDSLFAQGGNSSFQIYNGTGNDYIGAKFAPNNPFILKKTGTYAANDFVMATVRDDQSGASITFLKMLVFGAYDI
jgi:hypothetical protein